jgi:Flp pilus assembly protein TadG
MTMMKLLRRGKEESGAVAILVALLLPVLCGFGALVIDLGFVWETRRQLQNCVDAAALAAAAALPDQIKAYDTALNYSYLASTQGCLKGTDVVPTISFIDRNADGLSDAVRVSANRSVVFGFARLAGIAGKSTGAAATAGKINTDGVYTMEPFGLQVDPGQPCGQAGVTHYTVNGIPLQLGVSYTLKYTPGTKSTSTGDATPGNFQALALGATGGSNYKDNVQYSYTGWQASCETLQTETGNKVGPTNQGLDGRLTGDSPLDAWDNCNSSHPLGYGRWSDCPRVINIAIIPPLENGRTDTTLLTFGWFFIDFYGGNGNSSAQLTGKFIDVRDKAAPPGQWRGNTVWSPDNSTPWALRLID